MSTTTVELRWFQDGTIPESVRAWFSDVGPTPPSDWEKREDVYLPVPESHEIGIKCRGDSDLFEVKCRSETLEPVSFHANIAGRPEVWTKWSHAVDYQWVRLLIQRYPGTCRVRKSRLKRYYRVGSAAEAPKPSSAGGMAGDVNEVKAGAEILRGGILEVATLQVAGASYWSLAFEAFPFDQCLVADTIAAIGTLLGDLPVSLGRDESLAYPEWLARVTR